MKKAMLLSGAFAVVCLTLISCGGTPETTTTTTRQTTVTAAPPPPTQTTTTTHMADAADGVLLTARANRTTARELRKSLDQLGKAKVLGTVLVQ